MFLFHSSASRETSPHRVCNTSRHITSSLETSPTSSRTASPLPQDTDGEEEEFIDTVEVRILERCVPVALVTQFRRGIQIVFDLCSDRTRRNNSISLQSAPERSQKDALKSSVCPQKVQTTANNGIDKSHTENVVKESTELTNGYGNGHAVDVTAAETDSKRERGRQRTKKDDKFNAEFLNQIATTVQHLQRDLDRVTTRVRSLEGQALQALAPQSVRHCYSAYSTSDVCGPKSVCNIQRVEIVRNTGCLAKRDRCHIFV